ncbi:hypothetical protein Btru_055408 [Bulinus truncatus]|nr:hypothetical protein Btru_055408 [Bulinus truncatus]
MGSGCGNCWGHGSRAEEGDTTGPGAGDHDDVAGGLKSEKFLVKGPVEPGEEGWGRADLSPGQGATRHVRRWSALDVALGLEKVKGLDTSLERYKQQNSAEFKANVTVRIRAGDARQGQG